MVGAGYLIDRSPLAAHAEFQAALKLERRKLCRRCNYSPANCCCPIDKRDSLALSPAGKIVNRFNPVTCSSSELEQRMKEWSD